ncbi:MAG: hypothetical protein K1X28_02495 [Parachlamydiales bacterium]|nr:hypothetical protein [Parachlamydiales bacterium]
MSISVSLDDSAADVYSWIATSVEDAPALVEWAARGDVQKLTEAYLKSKGLSAFQIFREKEKYVQIVKKAAEAFAFIQVASGLRDDPDLKAHKFAVFSPYLQSPFAKSRISHLFDQRIRPDRLLLMPGADDIEIFSKGWIDILDRPETELAVQAMSEIQKIVDTDATLDFPAALQMYKLSKFPGLSRIPRDKRTEFIQDRFPFLLKVLGDSVDRVFDVLIRAQREGVSPYNLLRELIPNRRVLKGAFLIQAAHESAVKNADVIHNIRIISERLDWFEKAFSETKPHELETILERLADDGNLALMRIVIRLGLNMQILNQIGQMDDWTFSFLTPMEREAWKKKDLIIARGSSLVMLVTDKVLQLRCTMQRPQVHERVKAYIEDRDAEHVTAQFKKDGHRYDKLIISSPPDLILFPGQNSREEAKPHLLNYLKRMAEGDNDLFATLQEAVCQNIDKGAVPEYVRRELEQILDFQGGIGYMLFSPHKECACLQQIDGTHFKLIADYSIRVVNPNKIEEKYTRRVRLEFPIDMGKPEEDRWVIRQPEWIPLPDAALALDKGAKPLPPVQPEEQAVDKPVVVVVEPSEDDDEDDFEEFNRKMAEARGQTPTRVVET